MFKSAAFKIIVVLDGDPVFGIELACRPEIGKSGDRNIRSGDGAVTNWDQSPVC